MDKARPNFIVGIGGSAGGLSAYKALLGALPSTLGMAFVVVSHIDPDAQSQLVQILSRHTKMPVLLASMSMPILRNHVYVIPPNSDLLIERHSFKVVSPRSRRNSQVDVFFASLAEAVGTRAIGIILSGYHGDGTAGCKRIKAKGGTTFAQDKSAEVSGMPLSAQASGCIDFVLPPNKIPDQLARLVAASKKKEAKADTFPTSTFEQNYLLGALPVEVQDRVFPRLELTPMPLGKVLYEPGDTLRYVYFPTDSIVSLLFEMDNGETSEIAVVGNDGLIGISLFMGGESTPSRAVVQSAGRAYRLPGQLLKNEFNRHSKMMLLLLRYTQALMTQMTQTAACNLHHSIDQRLCRSLLLRLDRLSNDNKLTLTQDQLANVLGVRREGVTEAAGKLLRLGVIKYARGRITVLDRPKLEELSCECYAVVRKETDRLLSYHQSLL
jgi:CRP-like cAMP-binding protein